jgi:hypothetical protein
MEYLKFLFDESPSFEIVLSLREEKNTVPFKDYIFSKMEKIDLGEDSDEEYIAVVRAFNFLKVRHDDSIFYEALDFYEKLDHEEDYHEVLSSSVKYYLSTVVSDKHIEFLFERLKKYLYEDEEYPETTHLFELLLGLHFRNDEFSKICLDEFSSPYSDELTRIILATGFKHPEMTKVVKARLEFLAPYRKYFQAENINILFESEWNELGNVLYPDPEPYKIEINLENDEDFIIEVLGHTDDRSANMILERSNRNSSMDAELTTLRDERFDKLNKDFLDPLPDDPVEWMKTAPEYLSDQFIDFSNRLAERKSRLEFLAKINRPAIKIGRNEPCPCGSGKKYKKCHIDKVLP